ncbi:MAG: hypothetical protein K2H64_01330, partial [Desulfovibrio sp.]|nr:hypothetical protein [Desulfovibrio sp.]
MEKVDVAVNIFGKPWTAALTLLSLIDNSGERIAKLWTQFEPVGMKYDRLNPYLIIDYLREKGRDVVVSQPAKWVAREAVDEDFLKSAENRLALRYGAAFENSDAKYLLLIHNDILVFKDLIGAMLANIGDSFAIGQLGQCWNCPAAKASITEKIMKCPPCD